MPAPPARIEESDYVRLSQLYGGRARVTNERGEEFFPQPPAWHENDLAQAIARQPGGTAWFELDDPVDPKVQAAREAGGEVVETDGSVRVHVAAGVTHTLGGLRVDERARVLREDGTAIDGLFWPRAWTSAVSRAAATRAASRRRSSSASSRPSRSNPARTRRRGRRRGAARRRAS